MPTKTKKKIIKKKTASNVVDYKKKYDELFNHMDSLLSEMSTLANDIYDIGMSDRTIVETLNDYYRDTLKLLHKLEK
jgi:hypothetical protein